MLPLLISFVWGFKRKLSIFDPGVKIKKFYQGYLANTHKCPEQNFELRTVSSLGAVMSNPTHIHTLFSPVGVFGNLVLYSEKPPIDTLTAVDASRLL